MSTIAVNEELFFVRAGLDREAAARIVKDALDGCDDGELFLEARQSESVSLDDGRIKSAAYDSAQGFGLRAVSGDSIGYAHASEISEAALKRAASTVKAVRKGHSGSAAEGPIGTNRTLYTDVNPLALVPFEAKVALLEQIDAYARGREPRLRQVSASLAGSWQAVTILRADGQLASDIRPLVRLSVSVVVGDGDRMETGGHGLGGRTTYESLLETGTWRHAVDEALRQAIVNLEAGPAPAGEMPVVAAPGWNAVLLHEAIGHGLEGDCNRRGASAFAGLMGRRIAAPGVHVIDQGSIPGLRGAITMDDEGTPSGRTVLIEDGILVGFMQDRLNGRLTGGASTGNGRRQSWAFPPIPRMTCTYMMAGRDDPGEIVAAAGRGIFIGHMSGGMVEPSNGKFSFSATEAHLIENGRIGRPVKGVTLIGNGPAALTRLRRVGNDLGFDRGVGTCGKDAQCVPVGCGQPTLLLDGLTVGGTG
ncbi:MAG: metalloprotease TldD [Alphaproteobacteria bacterium]|nr:metalloprotease TldD [Alphaproteobacteria bacterium]